VEVTAARPAVSVPAGSPPTILINKQSAAQLLLDGGATPAAAAEPGSMRKTRSRKGSRGGSQLEEQTEQRLEKLRELYAEETGGAPKRNCEVM
jgi:hypothetical protein